MNPNTVFIAYGSLAPGRPNYRIVEQLNGKWEKGFVFGELAEEGWGSALGYPGLVRTEGDEKIAAYILFSDDLPDFWSRLDEFEGSEYERVVIPFYLEDGTEGEGNIYKIKD